MATVEPPRPGRPKRSRVDVLRTQLWFEVVKLRSGLPSAYAIELALEPPAADQGSAKVWRPRKWDGYESGRKVPTPQEGRRDSVAVAEAAYPGTARWFDSPLWPVLKKQPVDKYFVHDALRSLDASVVNLLMHGVTLGERRRRELLPLDESHLIQLAELGTFDALVATVLLIKLSEIVGSPDLREWSLNTYRDLQPAIAHAPETCKLYPELFSFIDSACPHWIYVSANERLNMHVFWHEVAKMTWAADLMPYIEERLGLYRD
jgi:hypothetical protein